MSRATMIRKQLYLTPEQNRALKGRSRALGVSEAELVRRALDEVVAAEGGGTRPGPSAGPLAELLASTRRLAEGRRLPAHARRADGRLDRDALYDERGGRGR